jgi:hypothetical protein
MTTTHTSPNAKGWLSLNKLRRLARASIVNHNRALIHRASVPEKAKEVADHRLADFDLMSKPIKNRQIVLLDERICDFVVDHIYDLDNQTSKVVSSVMAFYEEVTNCRE